MMKPFTPEEKQQNREHVKMLLSEVSQFSGSHELSDMASDIVTLFRDKNRLTGTEALFVLSCLLHAAAVSYAQYTNLSREQTCIIVGETILLAAYAAEAIEENGEED